MNDVSVKTAETANSTDWKTTTLQPPVQNTLNVESARAFVVVYVLRNFPAAILPLACTTHPSLFLILSYFGL